MTKRRQEEKNNADVPKEEVLVRVSDWGFLFVQMYRTSIVSVVIIVSFVDSLGMENRVQRPIGVSG